MKILIKMFLLLVLLPLSSCDVIELMDIKGEKVWVTVLHSEERILKINSITKNDKELQISAVIDAYDQQGNFDYTYIFQMNGEKEKGITIEDGQPLTILTDGIENEMSLKLSKEEKIRVKKHVLSQLIKIK